MTLTPAGFPVFRAFLAKLWLAVIWLKITGNKPLIKYMYRLQYKLHYYVPNLILARSWLHGWLHGWLEYLTQAAPARSIWNMSWKCYFVGFVCPNSEILHWEWWPMECGRFFQEVMIISRKNSRVYVRQGGVCVITIVRGRRAESQMNAQNHVVAFVRALLSAAFLLH